MLATGCSSIPQAVTWPVVPNAANASNASTAEAAALPAPTSRSHRWNFHDGESRVELESGELMTTFKSSVPRFRGSIASNPDRLTIDFDLRSLHNESRVVAAIIQESYLEVDTYPIAHLDVVIAGGTANGTLELHGVRRNIRFPITVERARGRVRMRSAFTLKRHDFNIVRVGGYDWLAREDVAIGFDLVAAPERVTVEEVP